MATLVGHDFFPAGRDNIEVYDDFEYYVTADTWTTVADNSGTVAVSDGTKGVVKINPSDATTIDNDQTYLVSTAEMFLFANKKPLVFETRVRPVFNTSANINVLAGVMNNVAADSIQDNGAGPSADYHGANFFLKDGDATWWCESSIGATQTTVDTGITAANNTWTTLRFEVSDLSSTQSQINFFIDDEECGWDVTTKPGQKITQTVTFSSATEMQVCLGCKNGSTNDSQYLDADYVGCRQRR